MRRTRTLPLALLSILAACVMTTAAASAESTPLPDIHTALPGETYPINLGGLLISKSELQGSTGGVLEGTDVSVLLQALALTSLGQVFFKLMGTTEVAEGHKCHTEGASEESGEVIFPHMEWHLVYTSLSPVEPLELGLLWLFTKFTISCNMGAFGIAVTGPMFSRLTVPTPAAGKEGDSTDIEIATHCRTPGSQELPYYYNDKLERVGTTLLFNVSGTGNQAGCEEIPGTLLLTPETGSSSTMFSVLF
jgi:hypothetical protein